jgi:hypothetical protein
MAYLDELAKLSTDILLKGIIETIIKDSPILQRMPFIDIEGTQLKYNRELTLPTVGWHAAGGDWSAAETFALTPKTAGLCILGGDADVDAFYQKTRSNVQDLEAAVIEQKAKAIRHAYENCFINGTSAGNDFDGIDKLTHDEGQEVLAATNGAALSLKLLDQLIDKVLGGAPDIILMSRRTRRDLNHLFRTAGGIMETKQDNFGNFVQLYNSIPVYINDWISDVKEVGTSGAHCSTVYVMRFGEDALCGLQNGGIQVEKIGALESYDANRTRIKWYCGLAMFSKVCAARLYGVLEIL